MAITIQRGNTYTIKITLTNDGVAVLPADISEIEVTFHKATKSYIGTDITYDAVNGVYIYSLTQAETFSLPDTFYYQTRVKFATGDVTSEAVQTGTAIDVLSKTVL